MSKYIQFLKYSYYKRLKMKERMKDYFQLNITVNHDKNF